MVDAIVVQGWTRCAVGCRLSYSYVDTCIPTDIAPVPDHKSRIFQLFAPQSQPHHRSWRSPSHLLYRMLVDENSLVQIIGMCLIVAAFVKDFDFSMERDSQHLSTAQPRLSRSSNSWLMPYDDPSTHACPVCNRSLEVAGHKAQPFASCV
jgi:hypothetical protein